MVQDVVFPGGKTVLHDRRVIDDVLYACKEAKQNFFRVANIHNPEKKTLKNIAISLHRC